MEIGTVAEQFRLGLKTDLRLLLQGVLHGLTESGVGQIMP